MSRQFRFSCSHVVSVVLCICSHTQFNSFPCVHLWSALLVAKKSEKYVRACGFNTALIWQGKNHIQEWPNNCITDILYTLDSASVYQKVKQKISVVSPHNNRRRPYWSFPLIKKMLQKTLYFSAFV